MIRDTASLVTARLTLRPLRTADTADIVAGVGNYDVSRWLAVVPFPYTEDDAHDFLRSPAAEARRAWAICDASGLVGIISFDDALGYWLAREVWGKGYAVEAGDTVLDAAFADPTRGALEASHMVGNVRSRHVLEKLGFREIGADTHPARALGQDVEVRLMRITRAEWRARRRYRLGTPRLALRELQDRDLPRLQAIGGIPDVARQLFAVPSPWPEPEARRYLEAFRYRGRPGFRVAIVRRRTLIGTVYFGIHGGMATCAWFLDPAHWGRGYVPEAAGYFLADVMDRFGIDVLSADHFEDNPASGAVMRKLGFVETGRGTGTSAARLEPAPVVIYRLRRSDLKVPA